MIPQTGVTQEIVESVDSHDTMALIDITKAINVTALDQLVDSKDTNREAQADIETTRKIIMTAHVHQVVSARRQTPMME